MKILITGVAGFIGFHLANNLLQEGYSVVGIDSLNSYYDVKLKFDRLRQLEKFHNFLFMPLNICDKEPLDELFQESKFDIVINLAAQAGVRFSIDKPYHYVDSNLIGFINILEACRFTKIKHLFFASSSSVYGSNRDIPFSVDDKTDSPVSLYAATKKTNELMAHAYAHLYDIPMTGLRFFTVYGPWGRPDMAYFSFTKNIIENKPIRLFNYGKMRRDFTYVGDVVDGIKKLINYLKLKDYKWDQHEPQFKVFNIGNNQPVELLEFVSTLEDIVGKKAVVEMYPMQDGDVIETYADINPLKELVGYSPKTTISEGLKDFTEWYTEYYCLTAQPDSNQS